MEARVKKLAIFFSKTVEPTGSDFIKQAGFDRLDRFSAKTDGFAWVWLFSGVGGG
jgi:hypothetical protein